MLRSALYVVLALASVLPGCGMVNARVISSDGKQYDLDGTPRVPPAERARAAVQAMTACADEVNRAQKGFETDAVPALSALSASLADARPRGAAAAVRFGDDDPLLRVDVPAAKANAKTKAKKARATEDAPPFAPAAATLSSTIRASLDATSHCSDANLNAVRVVWDEQRYLSGPDTHALLEAHWRATQKLARAKELAGAAIALGLAVVNAGNGKPAALAAGVRDLEDPTKLFVDVPFDHDLRREVLIQALHDTNDTCGKPDANGATPCDKIVGVYKSAKKAVDAVHDVQSGRILAALDKAMDLSGGNTGEADRQKARRLAVIALIPETPALYTLDAGIAAARTGRASDARSDGKIVASSDGVMHLLNDLGK